MNNDVKNYKGKVIGFRCSQCGEIKDRMWGTICNSCRSKEDLKAKIDELTNLLKNGKF